MLLLWRWQWLRCWQLPLLLVLHLFLLLRLLVLLYAWPAQPRDVCARLGCAATLQPCLRHCLLEQRVGRHARPPAAFSTVRVLAMQRLQMRLASSTVQRLHVG
jgi:hypothetical protein